MFNVWISQTTKKIDAVFLIKTSNGAVFIKSYKCSEKEKTQNLIRG